MGARLTRRTAAEARWASVARTVYHLLKYQTPYQDIGAKAYDQQVQDREVARVRTQAAQLGFTLTTTDA